MAASAPDLHHFEVFARVLEEKSVSKAARALGLAQPTVSGHLASLEKALGVQLFNRVQGEILPTKEGRLVYRYARDLLRLRGEALGAVEAMRGISAGLLEAGGSNIPGAYLLPGAIRSFLEGRPGVRVTLRVGDSKEILDAVAGGDLDLGVVGSRPPKGSPLLARPLAGDRLLLAVGKGHPWAGREKVSLSELPEGSYLVRERGSGSREKVEEVLAEAGLPPERLVPLAELGSNEAVKQAVVTGLGFSFLSSLSIAHEMECGLLRCPVLEGSGGPIVLERPFVLVTDRRRASSPLRREFEKHLLAPSRAEGLSPSPSRA
ncbi:MAG: LysR family transcriptional regulator [Planctomycetales bacterium]|nr:LysR family transcriptional regulator [Planctomycetales bacterium]